MLHIYICRAVCCRQKSVRSKMATTSNHGLALLLDFSGCTLGPGRWAGYKTCLLAAGLSPDRCCCYRFFIVYCEALGIPLVIVIGTPRSLVNVNFVSVLKDRHTFIAVHGCMFSDCTVLVLELKWRVSLGGICLLHGFMAFMAIFRSAPCFGTVTCHMAGPEHGQSCQV